VVEFDVDCFFCHSSCTWDAGGFERGNQGFRAARENIERAGCVDGLVRDHEDAELEGCHFGIIWTYGSDIGRRIDNGLFVSYYSVD
jgi:hypothetical protein